MSRRANILVAAALLGFAAVLWFWLIPAYAGRGDQAILPRIVAAAIALLSLAMLWQQRGRALSRPPGDDPFIETGGGEPLPILVLGATWGLFVALLVWLGFYVGGAAALLVSFVVLGLREPVPIALWAGGTLIAVHLVFERLMSLRLPRGALEGLLSF